MSGFELELQVVHLCKEAVFENIPKNSSLAHPCVFDGSAFRLFVAALEDEALPVAAAIMLPFLIARIKPVASSAGCGKKGHLCIKIRCSAGCGDQCG